MFLLVPAHPGFPGQIPQSRKTVVCVCVSSYGKQMVQHTHFVDKPVANTCTMQTCEYMAE